MKLIMRKKKKSLRDMDREFPRHFAQASRRAYNSAVRSGIPVVIAADGALWRIVKREGKIERTRIKDLPPPVPVDKSVKIHIR